MSPRRFLLAAALFHLVVTITIAGLGKARVFPAGLNEEGIGISFAVDSLTYRQEALKLVDLLHKGDFKQWLYSGRANLSLFHLKLCSIPLALLGPLLGYGILALEPLNLASYLLIVFLTYRISFTTFSAPVAQLAALMVSVWPSLLIHTTQFLRDPLFIGAMLLLVFCLVNCLRPNLSRVEAIKNAVLAGVAFCLILLLKGNVWEVVLGIVTIWIMLSIAVQAKLRKWSWSRASAIVLIVIGAFLLPKVIPHFRLQDRTVGTGGQAQIAVTTEVDQMPWNRVITRLGSVRRKMALRYPHAGSNVDTDVALNGTKDVLTYLPRATAIGLFSPFPRMWFSSGKEVGVVGRLGIGAEMLVLYICFVAAVVTLFHHRGQIEVWFLAAVTSVGCIALGYVVINIAALYRMRYAFLIPVIILAAEGFPIMSGRLGSEARRAKSKAPQ